MANLDFPHTVRIAGQTYHVQVVPQSEPMLRGVDSGAVGASDHNKQIIQVRGPEELSPHQAIDTLLHETLHGIVYLYGLLPGASKDEEERHVRVLATGLLATLRDNPQLVDALLADIDH